MSDISQSSALAATQVSALDSSQAARLRPDLNISSFISEAPASAPSPESPTILQPWSGGAGWIAQD
jgi:hypothetical protein